MHAGGPVGKAVDDQDSPEDGRVRESKEVGLGSTAMSIDTVVVESYSGGCSGPSAAVAHIEWGFVHWGL